MTFLAICLYLVCVIIVASYFSHYEYLACFSSMHDNLVVKGLWELRFQLCSSSFAHKRRISHQKLGRKLQQTG